MRALLLAALIVTSAAPTIADPRDALDVRERIISGVRADTSSRQQQLGQPSLRSVIGSGARDVLSSERRMERMVPSSGASEQQSVLRNEYRAEALGRAPQQSRGERLDDRWRDDRRAAERVKQTDTVTTWRQDRRNRERNVHTPRLVNDNWRESWRRDRRYDWRTYREGHRGLFRAAAYVDPFGWGYRSISHGSRLDPVYYSGRYALSDPWSFRLPLAPPGYRWVRYFDDALLIDVRGGEVVDALRDLFW